MPRGFGALVFAGIMIFGLTAEAKDYYRYRDDRGGMHYLEDPNQAPAQYRKRVQLVQAEVVQEEVQDENLLHRWQQRAQEWWEHLGEQQSPEDELQDLRLGGLIWYTLRETWLFYTLLAETLALLGFVLGLWYAQDYPTQRERRRYTIGLIAVYIILLFTSATYLVRPQLKNFFTESAVNADFILDRGGRSEAEQAALTRYRAAALDWAKRIP